MIVLAYHSSVIQVLSRVVGGVVIAAVVAACGSGLGSNDWLWCKEHPAAVDKAAESLQIAKVQTTVQEPSWLADYVTSAANSSNALIGANAAFIASCAAAAEKRGVGTDTRASWCLTDGLGDAWESAQTLGLTVSTQAETFAYRGLPIQQRLDNPDFVRACRTAHGS